MAKEQGVSRRGFVQGMGVLAAGTALSAGLAGCAPKGSAETGAAAGSSNVDTIGDPNRPGFTATPDLRDAEPIAPAKVPSSWTEEADYVVVGSGGGGLNAAVYLAQNGNSVILLEKQAETGGTSKESGNMLMLANNGRDAVAAGLEYPDYPQPYNRDAYVRTVAEQYQFTANPELLGNLMDAGGECIDWMQDSGAPIALGATYRGYNPTCVIEPTDPVTGEVVGPPAQTHLRAMKQVTDYMTDLAVELGVSLKTNVPATALVMDGDRVVGVQSDDQAFKGAKGVILCAGGFGMNPDMVKKYMPTAYRTIVHGGPFPHDTGEVERMALGCGAEMTGLDSWCTWEYAPDNGSGEWNYFWGIRQLTQLPWLCLDALGDRVFYFDPRVGNMPNFIGFGDTCGIGDMTSRKGARGYKFWDSKFEQYIFPEQGMPMALGRYGERCPMNFFADKGDPDPIVEQSLVNPDWKVQLEEALEDGRIVKADTLEELCEKLGLDSEIILPSIDKWNKACETKEDYIIYPYPAPWMNPVIEPPFYGSKTGGILGKCLTGLRVDPNMRVMNGETCKPIPGLYANMMTAGGACGESSYCGNMVNTSVLGGVVASFATGYLAAKTAIADNA